MGKRGRIMEIHATTVYDEKTMKDFIGFSLFKGRNYQLRRRVAFWIWPVLMLLLLGLIVLELAMRLNADTLDTLIFAFFLCVLTWAGLFYLLPAFLFRQSKKLLGTVNTFVFQEDGFLMSSESPLFKGDSTWQYSALHKVYETQNYLYLFITGAQAYILQKSGITGGTAEEIRSRMMKRLPSGKYVVCRGAAGGK